MDFKSLRQWAFKPNNRSENRGFLSNPFNVFKRRSDSSSDGHAQNETLNKNESSRQDSDEAKESLDTDDEMIIRLTDRQRMLLEKENFPGAEKWAEDEERLFEILYLRETTPLMPRHWNIDFMGAPMPENVFEAPEVENTIIRAFSDSEFSVTQAIEKMMYLTGDVIAAFESGLVGKPQKMIHKSLTQFLSTLAHDAGYSHLEIVPNIFVEPVHGLLGEQITMYMENRMKTLAGLQREFYREDRPVDFWNEAAPAAMSIRAEKSRLLHQLLTKKKRTISEALEQEADALDAAMDKLSTGESKSKRRRVGDAPLQDITDEAIRFDAVVNAAESATGSTQDSVLRPGTPVKTKSCQEYGRKVEDEAPTRPRPPKFTKLTSPSPQGLYKRTPPVIYGLFVMGASVFVLTVDSSEEHDPFVTFHLSLDFSDPEQAVWNALTVGIVGCRARDEISGRLEDFEPKVTEQEVDPDE